MCALEFSELFARQDYDCVDRLMDVMTLQPSLSKDVVVMDKCCDGTSNILVVYYPIDSSMIFLLSYSRSISVAQRSRNIINHN